MLSFGTSASLFSIAAAYRWIVSILLLLAPIAARGQTCVGDCDGDGEVMVAELIRGVNIALGALPIDQCDAFDRDENQTVAVDELVAGVRNALEGCPSPQSEVRVRGLVLGGTGSGSAPSPLPNAAVRATIDRNQDGEIQAEEETTATADGEGNYDLRVLASDGETVVVGYEADGFAPLFRTIVVAPGADAVLNVTLQPVESMTCTGPRCALQGGELTIEGLDAAISGSARVFNPVTETDAFPGDFSDSDGNLLVSGVFAAVELTDGSGQPVEQLDEAVTLRMRIPRDTWNVIQDIEPNNGRIDVPLYSFDEAAGTWRRDGQGVLEDGEGVRLGESALTEIRNGTLSGVVVARGEVTHFSYWNVDWPVASHACITGVIADAGGAPAPGATVLVRGVTYTGTSNPVTVGGKGRFCVEVMRSENPGEDVNGNGVTGETQRVRLRVLHEGKIYDGGEYDVPPTQGTCDGGTCTDIGRLRMTPDRELHPSLCTVTGTVRTIDGSPAEGAFIIGLDETVDGDIQDDLCAALPMGYCNSFAVADAAGEFTLTTVVLDSLYYSTLHSIQEETSSLLLFAQGSVQGCPTTPLNITLADGFRSVQATVAVVGNTISWEPSQYDATYLDVSGQVEAKWLLYADPAALSTPVSYGILPAGSTQLFPFDNAAPAPLASGDMVTIFVSGISEDGYPYWGSAQAAVP